MADNFQRVLLPSGNEAVYEISEHRLCRIPGESLVERIRFFGRHVATRFTVNGSWYLNRPENESAHWELADAKTAALLDALPLRHDQEDDNG